MNTTRVVLSKFSNSTTSLINLFALEIKKVLQWSKKLPNLRMHQKKTLTVIEM